MVCGLYYDLIDKYKVTAELVQPLHVGSADIDRQRILVHPINGNPFVQAAGIAGVFRDAYESFFGNAGRYQGLECWIIYFITYIAVTRTFKFKSFYLDYQMVI